MLKYPRFNHPVNNLISVVLAQNLLKEKLQENLQSYLIPYWTENGAESKNIWHIPHYMHNEHMLMMLTSSKEAVFDTIEDFEKLNTNRQLSTLEVLDQCGFNISEVILSHRSGFSGSLNPVRLHGHEHDDVYGLLLEHFFAYQAKARIYQKHQDKNLIPHLKGLTDIHMEMVETLLAAQKDLRRKRKM
jgi:hypothetical protein